MKGEESLQVSVGSKGRFLLRSHSTLEMDGLLTPAFLPDVGRSEGDADGDAQRCSECSQRIKTHAQISWRPAQGVLELV